MAELTKVKKSVMEESQVLPDMAGQDGKVLSNNGAIPIWIPKQKAERIVGEIVRFSFDTPPAGFFALDGSMIVNGKNDFAALANCGSRFITISGNNLILTNFVDFGRGKGSSGRSLGSFEGDAIRKIYGEVSTTHYAIQSHVLVSGVFQKSITGNLISKTSPQYTTSGKTGKLIFDASDSVPTANENRPKSLTELVCIYHGVI